MKIKAEYDLFLNTEHVVEVFTDHNGHWQASLTNQSTMHLTPEEARQILGPAYPGPPAPGTPITAVLGPDGRDSGQTLIGGKPLGPVGFGAEMQAL